MGGAWQRRILNGWGMAEKDFEWVGHGREGF